MKLSPHFTLEELTITQVRDVDNTPSGGTIVFLDVLAANLEHVRTLLGDKPLLVNSGYRSPGVNKRVGGVSNSAHCFGFAADFICPGFGTPLEICHAIAKSSLIFDQLIEEGTWVHISFSPTLRGQVMTKSPTGGYQMGLRI